MDGVEVLGRPGRGRARAPAVSGLCIVGRLVLVHRLRRGHRSDTVRGLASVRSPQAAGPARSGRRACPACRAGRRRGRFKARGSIKQAYVLGREEGPAADAARQRAGASSPPAGPTGSAARSSATCTRAAATGRAGARARASPSRCCAPARTRRASFYRGPEAEAGAQLREVRDGVELAMTVRLPAGKTLDDGPFPTLIEYSGYQVAAPNDLLDSVITRSPAAAQPTRSRRRRRPPSAR